MVTATNIKTEVWNKVVELLVADRWVLTYKYDKLDAGIDSDFLILEKDGEEILLGWDNWFEGEIQCSQSRISELENLIKFKFEFGEITSLKSEVIELNRKWKTENRWNHSIENNARQKDKTNNR